MTNSLLVSILFGFSAILIMFGIYFQTKAILDRGIGAVSFRKFWAISIKYSGFILLAYLVYVGGSEKLFFNLFIFIATYFVSFLLYLLARRVPLR